MLKPFLRCTFFFAVALVMAGAAFGQDWFRISTGLGVEKPRVAVADFAPRGDSAKGHSSLFTQVVRDDLGFSGILELASPSFYPQQQPSVPSELRYTTWTDSPVNAHFVAFGNLTETSEVAIEAWFYDVTNPSTQAVRGLRMHPLPASASSGAGSFAFWNAPQPWHKAKNSW